MRIFTFGRVVKLGLLGAGIYYVRTHGGARTVWNNLVAEANKILGPVKDAASNAAKDIKEAVNKEKGQSPLKTMNEPEYESAPSSPYGNEPGGNFTSDPSGSGYRRG